MKKLIRHFAAVAIALALLVGLPFVSSERFKAIRSGSADAVTGASTALDAPSGRYVILINRTRHTDKQALDIWQEFFENGESERVYELFEDISCVCAASDGGGLEMAKSFQSRLAENQMSIRKEDTVLMLSKAENGIFDVCVMSEEFYNKNKCGRIAEKTDTLTVFFSDTERNDDP